MKDDLQNRDDQIDLALKVASGATAIGVFTGIGGECP